MEPIEEIQGQGTKEDPYIATNWQHFLDKCNTKHDDGTTVYIKFADKDDPSEKVIDCNEFYENGVRSGIQILANVDFNGWTIKNLFNDITYTSASPSAILYINSSGTKYSPGIKNGNFENIVIKTAPHGAINTFISTYNGGYSIGIWNCNFSITLENSTIFSYSGGSGTSYFYYCSFNIKAFGKADPFGHYRIPKLYYCNLHIEHEQYEYRNAGSGNNDTYIPISYNCYIDGYVNGDTTKNTYFHYRHDLCHTIFNVKLKDVYDNSSTLLFTSISGVSLVNKDLINFNEFATNESGYSWNSLLKTVTTEELKDADVLSKLGFPVYSKK